jgi:TolA-binding protein
MKRTFLQILLILSLALFIDGTPSGADTSTLENTTGKDAAQEITTKSKEEKIKQLETQIKEQQEQIEQLQKQNPQKAENPVAKALRESWNCCSNRNIQISNDLVRIYFGDMYDIIYFFDGDASQAAHEDLTVFLKKTGLKTGTVEYYSAPEKKLFSISGSLSDAKTKKYF